MVSELYEPKKGDIVSLFFEKRSARELHGWRPALVISNDLFNERTGMAMVCPVTRTNRDYPFHVTISEPIGIEGQIMVDQIRSIDFGSRRVKHIGTASDKLVDEVLAILDACVY